MVGLFIIHPRAPYEPVVDQDIALITQEFDILPNTTIPDSQGMNFNFLTFNGRCAPMTTPLVLKLGHRVRLRFVNFSTADHHPIHLHGHTFWVTGTEGGRIPEAALPTNLRPSTSCDSWRRRGRRFNARMIAMAHRTARRHLCLYRVLALVAFTAFGDARQQQVRSGIGLVRRVAARARLLLVVLVIEPAVHEIAGLLRDRHHSERAPPGGRYMTFAA